MGAVMVPLLASLTVPVVGQEDTDTHVTGSLLACGQYGDRTVQEDDSVELHLFRGRCSGQMSDPRVSGTYESDIQEVCFKEAGDRVCMLSATGEIQGPDGTWVGTWGSVHDATLTGLPTWSVMEGTGAYEGWTYLHHAVSPFGSDDSGTSGMLFEGPPPPWEPVHRVTASRRLGCLRRGGRG